MRSFKEKRRDPAHIQKRKDAKFEEWQRQQHQDNVEIVLALNLLRDQIAADEQEETSDHRKRSRREWTTIILIFLTVATAFGGDWIFYITMQDARNASASSHSDSQQTIITNARAWLAPRTAVLEEIPLKLGEPIHVEVIYQNLGKQPALDMIANQIIETVQLPASGNWTDIVLPRNQTCDAIKTYREGQTIYPISPVGPLQTAESYSLHAVSVGYTFDGPIAMGAKTIYVQGCLAYQTFKERHYSSYCFYLVPRPDRPFQRWIFGICPNGGRAD